ncbi:unnamed protein product [Litomosoides sigmodontis]|uniref:Uncharacterized protein n=1 Tax=Litomosoides sigmodontis TaxID=42156 RepID=A0A3P6TLP5_LITSI|nr:unnamed protein product [Litomosoides sigmodontis]
MSLSPMKSLSDSLPVLFVEARLQGPPEVVFSQMGISFDADNCNFAVLMRTSGVLLVASVGSYMMYRVCARLLGRNFIWTILEQARFELLACDEKYLLNSRTSYRANNENDSCRCSTELTNKRNDCDSHTLSAISSSDHPRRLRQLYDGSIENLRKRSEITSQQEKHSTMSAAASRSSNSEKSASLHLLWDDPQWDEESNFCFYGDILHRGHHSVSSNVSDMTEFQVAKGLFDESDDRCKMSREDQTSHENLNQDERSSDLDANDFIQKNCMIDSKHLYQITTGFITRTSSVSLSSERSSQSFSSLRRRLIAGASSSGGLLELVQSSSISPIVSTDHMNASMTDSGISRGTTSTSNLQSSIRSTGAKYTFGAEVFSSEGEVLDMMAPITLTTNGNLIIGRNNLNLISEDRCSIITSAQSMEWFEDDYCPLVTEEDLREAVDDPLAACFSCSHSDQVRYSGAGSRRKHLYNTTRDLMAWARDQCAPKSYQLKVVQSLYMSHKQWRRIGLKRSSNCMEQFLSSLLHLMFIRGIPFFTCSDILFATKQE